MAFDVDILHQRTLVLSTWRGVATEAIFLKYIDQIWTDAKMRTYNELIDLRAIEDVKISSDAIQGLAEYSRTLDNPDDRARSAVVAPTALIYGLSRMFATLRALDPNDRREFSVFDDFDEAINWIESLKR